MKQWDSYEMTSRDDFDRIVLEQRSMSVRKKTIRQRNFVYVLYFDNCDGLSGWTITTRGQPEKVITYFILVHHVRE